MKKEQKYFPFCGGDAEVLQTEDSTIDGWNLYCISCAECSAAGPLHSIKSDAIKAWNRRDGK